MQKEKDGVSRREFLNTAATIAAVMAAGPVFKVSAAGEPKMTAPAIYVCGVCGHVEFGSPPDNCPVCHAPKEKFTENNSIFSDAQSKFPDGAVKHTPVVTVTKQSKLVPEIPCNEVSARVGKTMHPMEEAHHIKFIDFYIDDKFVNRTFLKLQQYPAVTFYAKPAGTKVRMVEWCTLHGYWQTETALA